MGHHSKFVVTFDAAFEPRNEWGFSFSNAEIETLSHIYTAIVQGDPSGCTLHFVDIKLRDSF